MIGKLKKKIPLEIILRFEIIKYNFQLFRMVIDGVGDVMDWMINESVSS